MDLLKGIGNSKHTLYEKRGRFKEKKDNPKKLFLTMKKIWTQLMIESSKNVTHSWHIEWQRGKGKPREILLATSHKQIAKERVKVKQRSVVKVSRYCWNQHNTGCCGRYEPIHPEVIFSNRTKISTGLRLVKHKENYLFNNVNAFNYSRTWVVSLWIGLLHEHKRMEGSADYRDMEDR